MAGWVAIQPVSMNAGALTGTFFTGGAPSASSGIDAAGSGTAFGTAWGSNNGVYVPNPSGNVVIWYYSGTTGGGVTQVLIGETVAGQVIPVATTRTLGVNESGLIGPLSPATYNLTGASITAFSTTPLGGAIPAAAAGCLCVCFTATTDLSVRAYSFANVQP